MAVSGPQSVGRQFDNAIVLEKFCYLENYFFENHACAIRSVMLEIFRFKFEVIPEIFRCKNLRK